jgi:DNA-directed RNA polymerase specialized sigma24 family protein
MLAALHEPPEAGPSIWAHPVTAPDPRSPDDAVVHDVRDLLARDDRAAALHALFAAYGAEVFGLLVGVLDDTRLADEVYADVVAQVSDELAHFEWACSLRVWLYGIARAALRARRKREHRPSDQATRDNTRASRALRPVVVAVRRGLSEEERELLILRIDRELDWTQLALVELGSDASTPEVATEARRMSARFDKLVERVRDLAELALKQR